MRVLITRPRQDAEPLARTLLAGGVQSLIEPLLEIHHLDEQVIDLAGVQGLLVTSANGVRAFADRSPERNLTVWAVGDGSAQAARGAGFHNVRSARGDVTALAELVTQQASPHAGGLLHVAGTRLAGDLAGMVQAAGFRYRRVVLYKAVRVKGFSEQACHAFHQFQVDGVLLYSPRTAATFVKLVEHHGMQGLLHSVTAYCLSQAVADRIADLDWMSVCVASDVREVCLIEDVFRATGDR